MPGEIYITASSIVCEGRIVKNGVVIFENKDIDASGFLTAAYQQLGIKYSKFYKMDHLSKLGWLAAEVLLKDSLKEGKYQSSEVGIVLQNASSSLDADLKYFESTKEFASPALFVYTLPNIVMGEICIKHKFKGENAFFIFETFNTDFVQKYVSNGINNNILQACICGWVEFICDEYKAVLFLVEKNGGVDKLADTSRMVFTQENLNKIYQF